MTFSAVRAVVFDYGNTLVEFGPPQVARCDDALAAKIQELFGPTNLDRMRELRRADRMAPYRRDFRENDLVEITNRLVEKLYDRLPTASELDALLEVRHTVVVECLDVEDETLALVDSLAVRYRIGILSNYPSGPTLRASLERTGLADRAHAVVVSDDVGFVKPHPAPFGKILEALDVEPSEALMVGDNWLADVQGGKRMGMRAAYLQRWDAADHFEVAEDHYPADVILGHLSELAQVLEIR